MTRRLCLSDWDGTLRPGYVLRDWAEYISNTGLVPSSFLSELEDLLREYSSGVIEYRELVHRAAVRYASALNGLLVDDTKYLAVEFARRDKTNLYDFCEPLAKWLHETGIELVIVSGAPDILLRAYQQELPISAVFGVSLTVSGNRRYTGRVAENYGLAEMKRVAAERLGREGCRMVLALGNAPSDLPLMNAADAGVMIAQEGSSYVSERYVTVPPEEAFSTVKELIGED